MYHKDKTNIFILIPYSADSISFRIVHALCWLDAEGFEWA